MNAAASSVCVIIAAWNAEKTVARAIASALAQAEVAEVVVVDDASTDDTVAVAQGCDDGSGRLHVLYQTQNAGPSAARNRAIAASTAPYIAILDSDDFLLPGRFAALFAIENWDAIVDDIAFIGESRRTDFSPAEVRSVTPAPRSLTLSAFVRGNISNPGKPRAELGFIKPVIRRAFLEDQGLAYDETLRLGEDYALYVRMLARGARFVAVRSCGYVAVERANSLSGSHCTADLSALLQSDRDLLGRFSLSGEERAVVGKHADQLAAKLFYRQLLDSRHNNGWLHTISLGLGQPALLPLVLGAYARDRFDRIVRPDDQSEIRYLFS